MSGKVVVGRCGEAVFAGRIVGGTGQEKHTKASRGEGKNCVERRGTLKIKRNHGHNDRRAKPKTVDGYITIGLHSTKKVRERQTPISSESVEHTRRLGSNENGAGQADDDDSAGQEDAASDAAGGVVEDLDERYPCRGRGDAVEVADAEADSD